MIRMPSIDVAGSVSAEGGRDAMRDEDLLIAYRETGDAEMFSELVHRYERELFGFLRRYLGDDTMAEDVFQATFLQIHLKCDDYQQGRPLRPWLYRIATNLAIDEVRRDRRHRCLRLEWSGTPDDPSGASWIDSLSGSDPAPAVVLDREERGEWVRTATASLPDHLRSAVNLVYFQGLKYREAADALSIPVGTLKSRMHAALARLKACPPGVVPQLTY